MTEVRKQNGEPQHQKQPGKWGGMAPAPYPTAHVGMFRKNNQAPPGESSAKAAKFPRRKVPQQHSSPPGGKFRKSNQSNRASGEGTVPPPLYKNAHVGNLIEQVVHPPVRLDHFWFSGQTTG